MNEVPARLVVQYGRYRDQVFELTHLQNTIGRSPNNDITFTDPEISRQHVRFVREPDGGYTVEDLGSTNGTFVNKERITTPTRLYDQDIVNLGDAIDLLFIHEGHKRPDVPTLSTDATDSPTFTGSPPTLQEAAPTPTITDTPYADIPYEEAAATPPPAPRRRWSLTCGCSLFISLFLCVGLLFFLDAYQGGRLLYCGPVRPLFEVILGPLGFSPICP